MTVEYMGDLRAAVREFFKSGPGTDPYSCYPNMHTGQSLKDFVECKNCADAYPDNVKVVLKDGADYKSKSKGRMLCNLMKNVEGVETLDAYAWSYKYGDSRLKDGSPALHRATLNILQERFAVLKTEQSYYAENFGYTSLDAMGHTGETFANEAKFSKDKVVPRLKELNDLVSQVLKTIHYDKIGSAVMSNLKSSGLLNVDFKGNQADCKAADFTKKDKGTLGKIEACSKKSIGGELLQIYGKADMKADLKKALST